jgi:hypothetical protein
MVEVVVAEDPDHSHVAVEALEDEGYEIGDESQEGVAATWMFNLK